MPHARRGISLAVVLTCLCLAIPAIAQVSGPAFKESIETIAPSLGAQAEAKAFIPLGESAEYFRPGWGASLGGSLFEGKSIGLRSSLLADWMYMADRGTGGINLFSMEARIGLPIRITNMISIEPGFRYGWFYGYSAQLALGDYGAVLGGDVAIEVPVYRGLAAELALGYMDYVSLARGLAIELGVKWRSGHETQR